MNTLCLSSGGIYGITIIGCLDYLISNNYLILENITKYVGTSVGSIISFLLTINYSIKEIKEITYNFNFNLLVPNIDLDNLFFDYGLDNINKLKTILEELCNNKINQKNISFNDLYKLTNKELIVITTNYNNGIDEGLSYKNTPELMVLDGILMSCCIPIIYKPILYNNNYYIDGAISCQLGYKYCDAKTTLCINIVLKKRSCNKLTNLIDYVNNILATLINSSVLNLVNNHNNYKIINLYSSGCNLISCVNKEEINELLMLGESYGKKFYVKEIKNKINYFENNIINSIINNIITTIENNN